MHRTKRHSNLLKIELERSRERGQKKLTMGNAQVVFEIIYKGISLSCGLLQQRPPPSFGDYSTRLHTPGKPLRRKESCSWKERSDEGEKRLFTPDDSSVCSSATR